MDNTPQEPIAPAVHQDTLKSPLKNPVTGNIHDSTSSYMKEVRASGCEVVGNELLSQKPRRTRELITDAVVMDKIERAEAIHSDPAKYRARMNENLERLDRARRLLGHG